MQSTWTIKNLSDTFLFDYQDFNITNQIRLNKTGSLKSNQEMKIFLKILMARRMHKFSNYRYREEFLILRYDRLRSRRCR